MNDNDIFYKIALSFIPTIGAVHAKTLISYLGGFEEVFKAKKSEILKIPGIGEKKYEAIANNEALKLAEEELKLIDKHKIDVVTYLDKAYPQRLKQQNDCPLLLYTTGNLNLNPPRTVAIIGTRSPSFYGQLQCEKIAEEVQKYNVTIVSGLAYGIDTIAHRTACQHDIPTIGVLGNGLQNIYPSSNFNLAQKMKINGGLVSEYPMQTPPDRENFPKRNRIIASLADVIIVVESAKKGGSFITAEFANNYSKDVFALPGKLSDIMSEGCNQLIKTHKAHLYSSVEDIAYINRWDIAPTYKQLSLMIELDPNEKKVLELIKSKPHIGLDVLVYETQIQLSLLSALLINLEFQGLIKSLPGKKYVINN